MKELDVFKVIRNQKKYDKAIEFVPYAKFLGIKFKEMSSELVFTMPSTTDKIGNVHLPAIHGGVIAGFMENAAIMHLMWTTIPLEVPKLIDFTIDYISSGRPQDTYAKCMVKKLGKRIVNLQVEAWQTDKTKPIAIARSHFKLTFSDG